MAPETLTFVADANATVPAATSFPVESTNQGKLPIVLLGYEDGSGDVQPLGDSSGVPVYGDTTLVDMTATTFNTPISIGDATSSTTLIAANVDRKGWRVQNLSTAILYVRIDGGTAAVASCHAALQQYDAIGQKAMDGDLSLAAITGIWASDAGGTAIGGDWE